MQRNNGSAWRIETVDTDGRVGLYPSLALDSAGHPQISYMDGMDDTVRYAAFDGSAWRVETLDQAGGYAGDGTSLVLDDAGHPRIAYLGTTGLKYATHDGTTWQFETVGIGRRFPVPGAGRRRQCRE